MPAPRKYPLELRERAVRMYRTAEPKLAAGALTSPFHTKATTATLRSHLVQVPARIARSARRITLHLPHNWPWQQAWTHLFDTVHDPPAPA